MTNDKEEYDMNKEALDKVFKENNIEEADIIHAFFELANNHKYLVHFNGNKFDLPYVTQKCEQLGLDYNFQNFSGVDIYKRISPYKFFLKLPNCKQKTKERKHLLKILNTENIGFPRF